MKKRQFFGLGGKRIVMTMILGVVLLGMVPTAMALEETMQAKVEELAAAGDTAGLAALAEAHPAMAADIAVAAAQANPDLAVEICYAIVRAVPDQAAAVVSALSAAFPDQEEDFSAAAADALADDQGAGDSAPGDPALDDGEPPTVDNDAEPYVQ